MTGKPPIRCIWLACPNCKRLHKIKLSGAPRVAHRVGRSLQATPAAVDNSAPLQTRPSSLIYRGWTVQTNRATSLNAGTSFPNQLVQGSDPATLSLPAGKIFYDQISGSLNARYCYSRDSMTHFSCTQSAGPNYVGQFAQSIQTTPFCGLPLAGGKWGGALLDQYGNPQQKMLSPPTVAGGSYTYQSFICRGSTYSSQSLLSLTKISGETVVVPEYAKNCSVGFAVIFDRNTGVFSPCTAFATSGSSSQLETTTKTLSEAITALTAAQKSAKVDYQTMATLVNHVWKQAAAQPGYDGIPYSVTQPVTSTDVQAWAQANPSAYPTVEALVAPITDLQTGLAPSTSTSTATQTNPATSQTSQTSTNPATQTSQVNLGPDPNIGSPGLESTPTAQMILAPLIALFPDLKAYNVPGHSGSCPKPTFEVFGTSIVMDQHCTIFEQQRSAIYAAGLLVFTLIALFIVFSA